MYDEYSKTFTKWKTPQPLRRVVDRADPGRWHSPTMDIILSSVTDSHPLSVRLHRVHISLDEYPEPFQGAVKTPTVAQDRGVVSKPHTWNRNPITVSLESQPASRTSGDGKGCDPTCFDPTNCWRHLDAWCFDLIGVHHAETYIK